MTWIGDIQIPFGFLVDVYFSVVNTVIDLAGYHLGILFTNSSPSYTLMMGSLWLNYVYIYIGIAFHCMFRFVPGQCLANDFLDPLKKPWCCPSKLEPPNMPKNGGHFQNVARLARNFVSFSQVGAGIYHHTVYRCIQLVDVGSHPVIQSSTSVAIPPALWQHRWSSSEPFAKDLFAMAMATTAPCDALGAIPEDCRRSRSDSNWFHRTWTTWSNWGATMTCLKMEQQLRHHASSSFSLSQSIQKDPKVPFGIWATAIFSRHIVASGPILCIFPVTELRSLVSSI